MQLTTIKPDVEPEEVAKRITNMYTGDVIWIEQYGLTEKRTMDKTKSNLVMIVHRIVGGWIYEVMADGEGLIWKPVFVPEQADVAGAVGDAIYNAITNLGFIPVRQT